MKDATSLRVGLAGLGRFGALHAAVLSRLPGVSLAAICDPDPDALARFAGAPEAARFTDYQEMLARTELDAVFIVTPEPLHAEQTLAAIARGLAVFVEKPLAMTAIEGASIARAAADAGVPLQVGFVLRFDIPHAMLRARLASGELGKLISLRVKRNVSRAWFPSYGDRAHPMQETAIHDVDLLLWFAASPVTRVQAVQRNLSGMRYPDGCWALVEFANGAVGMIETSWFVPVGAPANVLTPTWRGTIDAELEVIGDRGTGRIRALDAPLSYWSEEYTASPETGLWPEVGGSIGGALREELTHFLDRVRSGQPESTASIADAVAGLRVIEAVMASAESGQAVTLGSS
ncbi:MAG: Gfo/Idh/MocA family oxidoreductase [Thermomicrobiales bacterium]